MSEALTGDRRHFWLKPSPGRSSRAVQNQTLTKGRARARTEQARRASRVGAQPLDLAKGASEQELRLLQGGHQLQSDGECRDDPPRPW